MKTIIKISKLFKVVALLAGLAIAFPLFAQDQPQILGISHIAVKVSDIDKSVPFYRDFLGFAEQCRLNDLKDGTLKLVLFKVSDEQSIEVFTGLKPDENKLHQIAFHVADAEAMRSYLEKNGVSVPNHVSTGQMKNVNFTVKDPAGYTIEFVQYTPDGWTTRDKGKFMPDTRISDRITHPGVVVADVPAATHFYGDILGFKETWRGSSKGDVLSWINLRHIPSNDYVEFMLSAKTGPHFSLQVPDIEKAKTKLESNAYRQTYKKPIEPYVGKNGKRMLNLYDPDGIRVELMEPNTLDGKPAPPSDAPLPKPGK